MLDYSKYKLKSDYELTRLLDGKDNIIVLSCNKCFKVFDNLCTEEPEIGDFLRLADNLGKKVLSVSKLDFLCNEHRLRTFLSAHEDTFKNSFFGAPSVICLSCGIGTQTAADILYELFPNVRVYTACDSVGVDVKHDAKAGNENGLQTNLTGQYGNNKQHGLALSDKLCSACGQCFLNLSSGICPISGCPKTLLNGPCGGSKGGKCETDGDKDCVWERIYLSNQPTSEYMESKNPPSMKTFTVQPPTQSSPKSTDFNKVKRSNTNAFAKAAQSKRYESFPGGLYLKYHKDSTAFLTLQKFPIPKRVVIPMSQHAGMSADPIVSVGDRVMVGQKIGEAHGTLSSSVHASISGVVAAIASRGHQNIIHDSLCVTIDSDGKDELHKSVKPIGYWEDLDILDIDAIIAEKGIVGMGGAGFPTPVKLKSQKPIDTILLNGCESEPFITADHRIMLEKADDIIMGLQIVMKSTGAGRGIIVISDNKSDAIAYLESKTAQFDDIFVMALWSKYPQGAERMLILRTLGRKLKYGERPYDVGAIVLNVSTARAIGDAFTRGMPLIERAVTVSGEKVQRPGNYMVRIGTSTQDILNHCGVIAGDYCVKLGGPMMGRTLDIFDEPVIKGTNAVLALDKPLSCSSDCIRCGRCVDVCPMELLPLYFPLIAQQDDIGTSPDNSPEKNATYCIECGACDYICPSGIEICKAVRTCKMTKR